MSCPDVPIGRFYNVKNSCQVNIPLGRLFLNIHIAYSNSQDIHLVQLILFFIIIKYGLYWLSIYVYFNAYWSWEERPCIYKHNYEILPH